MKKVLDLIYLLIITFTVVFGMIGFLYIVSYMGDVERGIERLVLGV